MRLRRYRAERFRRYSRLDIEFHPRLNVLIGDNAAGKTSLIEAIHVLSRGRSFRTSRLSELGQQGTADWWVSAQWECSGRSFSGGMSWTTSEIRYRLDGVDVTAAEMFRAFPVQTIESVRHDLVDEGPASRRSYLDWGVFHVEPQFLTRWREYHRCLKQRNAALRAGHADALVEAFDRQLASAGEDINAARLRHLQTLQPLWLEMTTELLGVAADPLGLSQGWSKDRCLQDALKHNRQRHREMRLTSDGPHRADLRLSVEGRPAKSHVSRGQERLLITAFMFAQAELLRRSGYGSPLMLLDDFSAELSPRLQQRVIEFLEGYRGQLLLTAFEVPRGFADIDHALFHVEHDRVCTQVATRTTSL